MEGGAMPITTTQQLDDLTNLDSREYRLTDWEVEFVDSVDKQNRAGCVLSDRQKASISKIWDAAFIHGKRGVR
jgi:hypothetical protein